MCLSKGFYGFLVAGVVSLTLMAGCGGGGGGGGSSSTSDNNNTGDSTYSISGTVTDSSNVAMSGVTVALTGTGTSSATTDSSGNYSFSALAGGTYIVTPSKTGYTFTPTSNALEIYSSVSELNFVGSVASGSTTYSISGTVTDSSNVAMSGVTVAVTGTGTGSTTTDSSGNFTFTGLANGSYTVTPSKTGYTFNPSSTAVTVSSANVMGQNFVGTATGGGGGGSTAATGKMPDTNQTTSYTSTFGEDHDYTINPPSYTDNGDGTITDNVTGLVWQKQDDGTERTWADANAYCDTTTLGGYSDWRLPSQSELISIVDYGVYSPSINTTFFPDTISSYYWSSTTSAYSTSFAWYVTFYNGSSGYGGYKTYLFYARCVRGDQATQSLTDNGNGTVTDTGTNLTWQQGENSTMTWEAALSYCESLSLDGHTDWRLPNVKELSSLVDYTRYSPAINVILFPNKSSSDYWSSTTVAGNTPYAWGLDFSYGFTGLTGKTFSYYVCCVRGGE